MCGSQIILDICVNRAGQVTAFGQDVRACALGQASATLLARRAVGLSVQELETATHQLQDWLAGQAASPGDWPELLMFEPARGLPARHPAILLAFEAASEAAMEAAA